MQVPRFVNANSDTSFSTELKRRINNYFETTNQTSKGNWRLHSKAVLLVALMVVNYVWLVFYTPEHWANALGLCVSLAFVATAIGFNVMHDGSHGSFSHSKSVNSLAAWSLDVLGGSSYMWYYKHVVSHHTFTNIDGADDDIDVYPFFRFSPEQKPLAAHRFQHIYWVILYGLLYIIWIFWTDYEKYFRGTIGVIKLPKMTMRDEIVFWGSKVLNAVLFFAIPMYCVGILPAIIGFTLYAFATGLLISIVFQLAHIVEHTAFPTPTMGNMEDEWTVHQIRTTANFATRNRLVTWFMGGLNYQVEHHLFPKISHIHYPKINKIIVETCKDYGVAYHEYPYMFTAIRSHVRTLRSMGRAETMVA